jgi:hypothetical protein
MHKFGKKVKLEGAKKKKRSDDSESDTDERISKTLKYWHTISPNWKS